jgi:hypothetical protein
MTPTQEAVPSDSGDDLRPAQIELAGPPDEIRDDPPPVVTASVTRLAVFSARTGSWNRPLRRRTAGPAADKRVGSGGD